MVYVYNHSAMRKINRKEFIYTSGLVSAGILLSPATVAGEADRMKIRAIAFDAFPIFDPRPIFKKVNEFFPEKGKEIGDAWRATQFTYQWLRMAGNQYKNFWEITRDALDVTLDQFKLTLALAKKDSLLNEYRNMTVWPDVLPALQVLKEQGLTLGFLSNMTVQMLEQGIKNTGTEGLFDFVISTDMQQTYKPSPHAYQLGVDALKVKKEEILFAAFAGWDAAGAKWFGYPTFWVNRLNAPAERLDATPDGMGSNLTSLVDFVKVYNKD